MQVLVSGATGKVGYAIASALLDRGDQVRAVVRDPKRAAGVLPAGIEPIQGDATDPPSLAAAVVVSTLASATSRGPSRATARKEPGS